MPARAQRVDRHGHPQGADGRGPARPPRPPAQPRAHGAKLSIDPGGVRRADADRQEPGLGPRHRSASSHPSHIPSPTYPSRRRPVGLDAGTLLVRPGHLRVEGVERSSVPERRHGRVTLRELLEDFPRVPVHADRRGDDDLGRLRHVPADNAGGDTERSDAAGSGRAARKLVKRRVERCGRRLHRRRGPEQDRYGLNERSDGPAQDRRRSPASTAVNRRSRAPR